MLISGLVEGVYISLLEYSMVISSHAPSPIGVSEQLYGGTPIVNPSVKDNKINNTTHGRLLSSECTWWCCRWPWTFWKKSIVRVREKKCAGGNLRSVVLSYIDQEPQVKRLWLNKRMFQNNDGLNLWPISFVLFFVELWPTGRFSTILDFSLRNIFKCSIGIHLAFFYLY